MNKLYFLVEDAFKQSMTDARNKGKKLTKELSYENLSKLEKKLKKDLADKGYEVESLKISLAKFRGNYFVTSAKLYVKMKANQKADDLLKHLVDTYSPKFKLKNTEGAIAFFNVR
jgi:hypothetical protein